MKRLALFVVLLFAAPAQATLPPGPVITATGESLSWTTIAGATTYEVKGTQVLTKAIFDYPGITATTFTPPAQPESTVGYKVRATAPGTTKWSNGVKVKYGPAEEPPPEELGEGKVKTRLDAKSAFDSYPLSWFGKLSRLLAYPTAGDRYTSTVPTLAYHDAWTTWGSQGATHKTEYVAWAHRDKGVGYLGQFMDDVNFAGGNIAGTRAQYRELIEAVRAEVGTGVIEINAQYADINPLIKAKDPDVLKALEYVNVVTKEFNVDPTSGINTATKFLEFTEYVGFLHAKGVHITMAGDSGHNTNADKEYSLAAYLLNNDGGDFIGFSQQSPSSEYGGLSFNVGNATSPREHSGSVWKRSFTAGVAYTVDPGAAEQTITLPKSPMTNANGEAVTSPIKVKAANGVALHN